MIHDMDDTLKQILIKNGKLNPDEIDIRFETPDREWSASLSKPTVNLYLYDIRENHELRGTEWIVQRSGNNTATKRKNASRIDLSYLVTVWTNNIEDQHSLLWGVLSTLIRYPTIPQDLLQGELTRGEYPILTHTAQPDGLFNNPADFWAALDNEIKPSFNYVVTVPMDLDIQFTSSITRTRALSLKTPDSEAEVLTSISGIVHFKGQPEKVLSGVNVLAKEANMSSTTDEKGQYTFNRIPEGKQILTILIPGQKQKECTISVPSDNYNIEV